MCVNPHEGFPSMKKDKIYLVEGSKTCSCGEVSLNVGFLFPLDLAPLERCLKCNKVQYRTNVIAWFSSSRFRKVDEQFATDTLANIEKTFIKKEELQTI